MVAQKTGGEVYSRKDEKRNFKQDQNDHGNKNGERNFGKFFEACSFYV